MNIGVVSKNKVPYSILNLNGFYTGERKKLRKLIKKIEDNLMYQDREKMEIDPNYIQPIPYIVFHTYGDNPEFLVYQRSKQSGENRLHNYWSIGVGGHIDYKETLRDTILREVKEELNFDMNLLNLYQKGIIYDSTVEVSSVHLGIVYFYRLSEKQKDEILHAALNREFSDIKFNHLDEFKNYNFENWSEYIIKYLSIKQGKFI